MTNTAISDLGQTIEVDNTIEKTITALGNGTLKAGNIVGINNTTGKIQALNVGTLELGCYIVKGDGKTAIDTALPDGKAVTLIVPKSGHNYRVFIADQGAAKYRGQFMKPNASAVGELTANTDATTAGNVAILNKDVADDDRVAEVTWL